MESKPTKGSRYNLEGPFKVLNQLLQVLAAFVAYLLTVALFIVGFWEIGKGVGVFFGYATVPVGSNSQESAALELSLKGLEFLFLAPLPYLTLLSVVKYAARTSEQDDQHLARLRLTNVKMSIVSLLIAIIATDLVAKILREGLTYEATFTEGFIIVILGAYFFCLERLANLDKRG